MKKRIGRDSAFILLVALAVWITTLCAAAPPSQQYPQPTPNLQPIVVLAEKTGGVVVYTIDSKPVPKKDMLRVLRIFGDLIKERGRDTVVLVLVDGSLPVDEFGQINGAAGKAGFVNFRHFTFGSDRRFMSEVRFGLAVPFSTSPPVN